MATNADTALFKSELVFFGMECKDRWDFFQQLHDKLDALGYIEDGWLDGITTREKNYPTGLTCEATEIAIPHTDPQYIKKPYIAIVKPKDPVEFVHMATDDVPVQAKLIINLGVLRDGGQVAVLQNLMNIFMDNDAVADIMSQTTPDGMIEAITSRFKEV
jgi:PTS system galactitol-specific IIA component